MPTPQVLWGNRYQFYNNEFPDQTIARSARLLGSVKADGSQSMELEAATVSEAKEGGAKTRFLRVATPILHQ